MYQIVNIVASKLLYGKSKKRYNDCLCCVKIKRAICPRNYSNEDSMQMAGYFHSFLCWNNV